MSLNVIEVSIFSPVFLSRGSHSRGHGLYICLDLLVSPGERFATYSGPFFMMEYKTIPQTSTASKGGGLTCSKIPQLVASKL